MWRTIKRWLGRDNPSPEKIAEVMSKYAADAGSLETKRSAVFFIYDEMMKGRKLNKMIEDFAVPVCTGFTKQGFSHFVELGEIPRSIPLPIQWKTVPYLPIRGEVYCLLPTHIVELDLYKRVGVEFDRIRVDINIPHRLKSQPAFPRVVTQKMWMYVARPEFFLDRVDGGYKYQPVPSFGESPITGKYSYFIGEKKLE